MKPPTPSGLDHYFHFDTCRKGPIAALSECNGSYHRGTSFALHAGVLSICPPAASIALYSEPCHVPPISISHIENRNSVITDTLILSIRNCRIIMNNRRNPMTKKKRYSAVKQVKRLSRTLLRSIPGRPIQSKKPKVIEKILERESQELIEET